MRRDLRVFAIIRRVVGKQFPDCQGQPAKRLIGIGRQIEQLTADLPIAASRKSTTANCAKHRLSVAVTSAPISSRQEGIEQRDMSRHALARRWIEARTQGSHQRFRFRHQS